jgi:hypothetical protein
MDWPGRAWKALKSEGAVSVLTGNLAEAILHGESGETSYTPEGIADNLAIAAEAKQRTASPPKKLSQAKAKVKKESTSTAKRKQQGGGAATEIASHGIDDSLKEHLRRVQNDSILRDKRRGLMNLESQLRDRETAEIRAKASGHTEAAAGHAAAQASLKDRIRHLQQEIATLESGI